MGNKDWVQEVTRLREQMTRDYQEIMMAFQDLNQKFEALHRTTEASIDVLVAAVLEQDREDAAMRDQVNRLSKLLQTHEERLNRLEHPAA